ncbi:DHHC palmitoyltransferase domain-containing protein [Trichoderma austrokoningii]
MSGFNDAPFMRNLAVPAVCLLIAFLGYFSQLLFNHATLDPGPLSRNQSRIFNLLLACLWISYFRSVTVAPGRYIFPDQVIEADNGRWCKKCQAPKPPRAHHCRHCERCIPRMDHHCPWTRNCVSMTTLPHFLRFLVYANVSLWTLSYFLWQRFYALWETRYMPAHLGPTLMALESLVITAFVCGITSFTLGIMLVTTLHGWVLNRTTIEGWELDRHEANIRRGSKDWWDMTGPDGEPLRLEKVEFPYDIGFFANMAQAMGTANVLLWFFPLAGNPTISKTGSGTGWTWEENGFNRKEGMWPPLDPEKLRRAVGGFGMSRRNYEADLNFELENDNGLSLEEQFEAFRKRQDADLNRRKRTRDTLMAELEEMDDFGYDDEDDEDTNDRNDMRNWANSDGEYLRDYGVDEDAEVEDEDVPLAELLRRRRVGNTLYKDE